MNTAIKAQILSCLVLGVCPTLQAQNLLVNGGFELPGRPSPNSVLYLPNGATTVTGWVSVDNVPTAVQADNLYYRAPYYGHPAADGEHFVVIDNNSYASPSLNGLYQNFATVPGQVYRVTFAASTEISHGNPGLLRVSAGDTTNHYALTNVNGFPLPPTLPYNFTGWRNHSFTFTAIANSTRLQFADEGFQVGGDPSIGNASPMIDKVSVELERERVFVQVSEVEIYWTSRTNKMHQVQYRSTLTSNTWVDLGVPIAGNGSRLSLRDSLPSGEPQRFYRVNTVP